MTTATARETFDYTTTGREGIRESVSNPATVKAVRYAPGLILHEAFQNHQRGLKTAYYWTVAHEPTGFRITSNDLRKTTARYIAGTLAALPVDWTKSNQADFFAAFNALPQDVLQLVHLLRKVDDSKAA